MPKMYEPKEKDSDEKPEALLMLEQVGDDVLVTACNIDGDRLAIIGRFTRKGFIAVRCAADAVQIKRHRMTIATHKDGSIRVWHEDGGWI